MKKVVFLCSGGGGNFRFLYQCKVAGLLSSLDLGPVVAEKPCRITDWCLEKGHPAVFEDFKIEKQANGLLQRLEALGPDVIVTTIGRIIAPQLVEIYRGRMINLHYSLLPAHAGLIGEAPVRAALELRSPFIGCTVHYVDDLVDGGRQIAQLALPTVLGERMAGDIMNTVFRAGALSLAASVMSLVGKNPEERGAGVVTFPGRLGYYNGPEFPLIANLNLDKVFGALDDRQTIK